MIVFDLECRTGDRGPRDPQGDQRPGLTRAASDKAYKMAGLALAALGVYLATRPRETRATPGTRLRDGREVLIRPIRAAAALTITT